MRGWYKLEAFVEADLALSGDLSRDIGEALRKHSADSLILIAGCSLTAAEENVGPPAKSKLFFDYMGQDC